MHRLIVKKKSHSGPEHRNRKTKNSNIHWNHEINQRKYQGNILTCGTENTESTEKNVIFETVPRWEQELKQARESCVRQSQMKHYTQRKKVVWKFIFGKPAPGTLRSIVKDAYRASGDRIYCGQVKLGKSGTQRNKDQLAALRKWCGLHPITKEYIVPTDMVFCNDFNEFWEYTFHNSFKLYYEKFINLKDFNSDLAPEIFKNFFTSEDAFRPMIPKIEKKWQNAKASYNHPPWYDVEINRQVPHMTVENLVFRKKYEVYSVTYTDKDRKLGIKFKQWKPVDQDFFGYKNDYDGPMGMYLSGVDTKFPENKSLLIGSRIMLVNGTRCSHIEPYMFEIMMTNAEFPLTLHFAKLKTQTNYLPGQFAIGNEVEMKNEADVKWKKGIVIALGPLTIRYLNDPDTEPGYTWDEVRHPNNNDAEKKVTIISQDQDS